MFENNPYQPPKTRAPIDRRRAFQKSEILATVIGLGSLVLLGGGGSFALASMAFANGEVYAISPTLLYFLVSSAKLAGRMPGDLLCGLILGAGVKGPPAWWILGGIAGYLFTMMLFAVSLRYLGMVSSSDAVPLLAVLVRDLGHMVIVTGYVAIGIVAGRRIAGVRCTKTRRGGS